MGQLRYLGTTVTDQEDTKRRCNFGNAYCHLVQNIFSFRLQSNNLKTRIYKTISLPAVLYGRETWSLLLRDEHRLRVFEKTGLRRTVGPQR
jgi:hypothetical protein